jgi:formylglycine-generating enzyme required for sulfatase activity
MSGNVWEWTRSLWGTSFEKASFNCPYKFGDAKRENLQAPDDVLRVLRGGSFDVSENYLRAASRYGCAPDNRYDDFGFRLVASRFARE